MIPIHRGSPVHLGRAALATVLMPLPWLVMAAIQRAAGPPLDWQPDLAWWLFPAWWLLGIFAAFCLLILLPGFMFLWLALCLRGLWRLGR